MDNTLQELLTLVEKGNVEQRCAALLVLGALKISNAATAKLVGTLLDSPNPVLKDYALRYFEEVQPKNNTVQLLKMLDDGDKEMQERAVRSLTGVGQGAVSLLIQGSKDATRVWQMNAARVLAAVRGKAALKGLLQMLSAGTDETNKVICDLMTPALREMESKELDAFYDEVEAFAAKLDVKQQRPAAVSTMRLLGQLGPAAGAALAVQIRRRRSTSGGARPCFGRVAPLPARARAAQRRVRQTAADSRRGRILRGDAAGHRSA